MWKGRRKGRRKGNFVEVARETDAERLTKHGVGSRSCLGVSEGNQIAPEPWEDVGFRGLPMVVH
jgi:hypothetical protein